MAQEHDVAVTTGGPGHPRAVAEALERAEAFGWRARVRYVPGPPRNVAIMIARPGCRAFAWWRLDGGVRWQGGSTDRLRHLRTASMFAEFLRGDFSEGGDGA